MEEEDTNQVRGPLHESEARYRLLFESDIAGFCVATVSGSVIECNRVFARTLGYDSPEEVTGDIFSRVIVGCADERSAMESSIRTDRRMALGEYRLRRKDGTPIWVAATATVLDDGERPGPLVYIAVVDIDERKALELQLQHAQRMEAVSQLARVIARDFNNLLMIVLTYTDALIAMSQDPLGSRPARALQAIHRSAERAAILTRQLLAFTRQHALSPSVLDLNAVVESSEALLRRVIGEQIDLVVQRAPDLWRIKADRSQVEQIVMNLIVNARDAMPLGGTVRISTSNVVVDERFVQSHLGAHAGDFVLLRVADTGSGMDEQTKARIFEPFLTTNPARKAADLGLCAVYGIVKQNGGYISVTGEEGGGTTFEVYLPRISESPSDPDVTREAANPRAGSETILLVEGEQGVRDLLADMLTSQGYRVLAAADGTTALDVLRVERGRVHLILADLVAAQMNGLDLARRARAIAPNVRLLLMSGYVDEAYVRADVGLMGPILPKPFSMADLGRRVREALDR